MICAAVNGSALFLPQESDSNYLAYDKLIPIFAGFCTCTLHVSITWQHNDLQNLGQQSFTEYTFPVPYIMLNKWKDQTQTACGKLFCPLIPARLKYELLQMCSFTLEACARHDKVICILISIHAGAVYIYITPLCLCTVAVLPRCERIQQSNACFGRCVSVQPSQWHLKQEAQMAELTWGDTDKVTNHALMRYGNTAALLYMHHIASGKDRSV